MTQATGGTVTYVGAYTYHTFTSSGDFIVSTAGDVDVLLVAGGGGGGNYYGGGGGGGGLKQISDMALAISTYPVVVGNGGIGGGTGVGNEGGKGEDSTFNSEAAEGGGGGGAFDSVNGGSGGSGGGARGSGTKGSGTAGQGYDGGEGSGTNYCGSGGGAGGAGNTGTDAGANGGVGLTVWENDYAGGGAGSRGGSASHGGGYGGDANKAGEANTGGGGSEGNNDVQPGGAGGSGIVVIRYLTPVHRFTVTTGGEVVSEGDTQESLDPFSVAADGSLWTEGDTEEYLNPLTVSTGGSVLHEEDTEEYLNPLTVTTSGQIQYEVELVLPGAFTSTTTGELLHGEFDITGASRQYEFRLTGKADGLSDITIPIKSFQSRLKSGDPSYLSVVIPTYKYADDITDRSNGQMVLRMRYVQDGEVLDYSEIARADLDNIQIDRGANSQSITLTGYGTSTYSAKAVTLESATYHNLSDGLLRYRCKPDLHIRPGDTVTVDGNTFTANTISWSVSAGSETFEVTEAD